MSVLEFKAAEGYMVDDFAYLVSYGLVLFFLRLKPEIHTDI